MDDRQLRASDAERDAVIEQLRDHTAHGRLSLDEFEERVTEALNATTRAGLDHVLRELPPTERPAAPIPEKRRPRFDRSRVDLPRVAAIVVGVLALAVVLQGHFFWWLIPIFFWTGGFGLFGSCSGGDGRRSSCWSDAVSSRSTHATDTRSARTGQLPDEQLTEV